MSLLILAIVIVGFSYTIDHNLLHPHIPSPPLLYVHSFVFCAWVLFFILQSALVRSRKVRLHQNLGWLGVCLAISMVVLGYMTSTTMTKLSLQYKAPFPTESFLIVDMMDLICFAIPIAMAIYWRKHPDLHRRLMLIGTCALMEAAFGRMPISHIYLGPVGVDALILFGAARDAIVDRRVHKVYLYALPPMVLLQIIAEYTFVQQSSWWSRCGNYLLR
jgi:hypothetical protein